MIDWLSDVIVPFSLTASLLLVLRWAAIDKYGPQISYLSWLLLPASLIVPAIELPNWFASVSGGQSIQQFIVTAQQEKLSDWYTFALQASWALGASVLITFWLLRHISSVKYIRTLEQVDIDYISSTAPDLNVYASQDIFSPMLIGLFRQKLIIPHEFDEIFTKEQQLLILDHELCHYRRGDMVWNTIALTLLALMWFHPLAWLAFSRFRRDQELSCDQTVLARKHTTCRISYSKALVVAAETAPPLAFAQLSFKEYGDKNVMFERINFIKKSPSYSKLVSATFLAGAVGLLSAMSHAGDNQDNAKYTKTANKTVYPVTRVEPIYPEKAAKLDIEGSVVLKFDIASSGTVENVSVVKATPKKIFDKAAKIALRQWTYEKSSAGSKNNLVQLDFLLGKASKGKFQQVEQIAVVNDH